MCSTFLSRLAATTAFKTSNVGWEGKEFEICPKSGSIDRSWVINSLKGCPCFEDIVDRLTCNKNLEKPLKDSCAYRSVLSAGLLRRDFQEHFYWVTLDVPVINLGILWWRNIIDWSDDCWCISRDVNLEVLWFSSMLSCTLHISILHILHLYFYVLYSYVLHACITASSQFRVILLRIFMYESFFPHTDCTRHDSSK